MTAFIAIENVSKMRKAIKIVKIENLKSTESAGNLRDKKQGMKITVKS